MLEIYWSPAARWALRSMPSRDAARVHAAVQQFATTGEGKVTRVLERDPRALRLYVFLYALRMYLDPDSGALTISWLYREG